MSTSFSFLISIIVPIGLTFFVFWRVFRSERRKSFVDDQVIVTEYAAPERLTPAEVGAIFDHKVSGRDITAELIHLSIKGYISIEKIQINGVEDFVLTLLKDPESGIASFERDLLKHLFMPLRQVQLSSLKYNFFAEANDINYKVWDSVVQKGYADIRPIDYFIKYGGTGAVLGVLGGLLALNEYFFLAGIYLVGALMIFISLKFFEPLTTKGLEMRRYLAGLQRYLETAERQRLLFFSGPDLKSFEFDPLVPYALALGVIPEWARAFGVIYETEKKK